MRESVVFLGHSYVRRLREDGYLPNRLRSDARRTKIMWKGHFRSQKINLIMHVVVNLDEIMKELGKVDVMFLFLGSNDLISYFEESAETIAEWLYYLGVKLRRMGVKQVCFIECLQRKGEAGLWRLKYCFNTWNQAEEVYNKRVLVFNSRLKSLCKGDKRMNFEPLSGFRENLEGRLIDGIHLDHRSRDKLREELRRALLVN